jgi:hypothetical protein
MLETLRWDRCRMRMFNYQVVAGSLPTPPAQRLGDCLIPAYPPWPPFERGGKRAGQSPYLQSFQKSDQIIDLARRELEPARMALFPEDILE